MVEEFLKGAEEAGAETENIILAEKISGAAGGNLSAGLRPRAAVLFTMTWKT